MKLNSNLLKSLLFSTNKICYKLIISVLTVIASLLWIFSILEARVNLQQGIGDLGLTSILPVSFFIAFSLLSFAFIINLKLKSRLLFFFQTILLICFINLTPFAVEGTSRLTWSYVNYRSVDYITQFGQFNPTLQWILNWPGFSIINSMFTQITTISPELIVGVYPTFFNIILLFPLILFFGLFFKDNKLSWLSIWVFFMANWIGQDYFSMQSSALLMLILILFGIFGYINFKTTAKRQLLIILVLLFSFIVFTHLLTSLIIISILLVFYASKYFRRPIFFLLSLSIFLSWTIYGAITYIGDKGPQLLGQAFDLGLIFQSSLTSRIAGSPEHQLAGQMRIIFTAGFILFALIGFLLTWKREKIKSYNRQMVFVLIGTVLLLGFVPYGGEIVMRAYFLSLVPLTYFIVKGLTNKAVFCIFAIFLVAFAPCLHMVTHYGNEIIDYVPYSELKGAQFADNTIIQGHVVGPSIQWAERTRDLRYSDSVAYYAFADGQWNGSILSLNPIGLLHLEGPNYIGVTYGVREYYSFFVGDVNFTEKVTENVTGSVYYDQIYSNPNYQLYLEYKS